MSPEKSQVIPSLIRKALRYPQEEFVVWGSGRQRRAFVFVQDVVDALETVLQKGMNQGVIQIGPDYSTSIKEIAEYVRSISGKQIDIRYDRTKPEGDVDRAADWSKARDILDWSPTTSIAEGLERTYAWCERQVLKEVGRVR
jgi:nucleoside-diphosphate-sugar epimerase